jgi:hypothetical protein
MKKLFFIFCVIFQATYLLAIDDWDNPENFKFQIPAQDSFASKSPNKPVIFQHLPNEAYDWVKSQYLADVKSSKEFIEFLKKRSDFHDSEIEAQWKLIQTFAFNHMSNKNLTSLTLPMAAFAHGAIDLFYYQFTAESCCYSSAYPLTTFEQKYPHELYPMTDYDYIRLTQSTSPTIINHYKKTVLKKWARYLLKKLSKK